MRFLKRWVWVVTLLASGSSPALEFVGLPLQARDRADACYLIFMRLYRATYYASAAGDARCVELEYQRAFTREELSKATLKIYSKLYGDDQSVADAEQLQRLAVAYAAVSPGDQYRFCVSPSHAAELVRDGVPVLRIQDPAFAQRVFGIWVTGASKGGVEWNFTPCSQRLF